MAGNRSFCCRNSGCTVDMPAAKVETSSAGSIATILWRGKVSAFLSGGKGHGNGIGMGVLPPC